MLGMVTTPTVPMDAALPRFCGVSRAFMASPFRECAGHDIDHHHYGQARDLKSCIAGFCEHALNNGNQQSERCAAGDLKFARLNSGCWLGFRRLLSIFWFHIVSDYKPTPEVGQLLLESGCTSKPISGIVCLK